MNQSVIVSLNKLASTQKVSILGLSESNWVLVNVWSGRDPDTLDTLPKEQKGKSPSNH